MDPRAHRVPHGMQMHANWNGVTIAESDRTVVVEGNHYFPPEAIDRRFVRASKTHTRCPWKGRASYYDVVIDGSVNRDAAWYYPKPWPLARKIRSYVAFWGGVIVEPVPPLDSPSPAAVTGSPSSVRGARQAARKP